MSIVTAVYNQLPVNQLYWETVVKNTQGDFELIIVDNGSTDGSLEFFRKLAQTDSRVVLIENDDNYSYPFSNNRGLEKATGDVIAFLNNDILLSPCWDEKIRHCLGRNGYHVLSLSSSDRIYDKKTTKKIKNRFKLIKNVVKTLFGVNVFTLKLMAYLTYGNFGRFSERLFQKYGYSLTYGFSGAAIITDRKGIELIGSWDETQQGADFDVMLRSAERHLQYGDVKPCAVVNGIYCHHFSRLTLKGRHTVKPFRDADRLVTVEAKWEKVNPQLLSRVHSVAKFNDVVSGMDLDGENEFEV